MSDSNPQINQEIFFSMQGICKQFPGVLANDQVNLDLHRSEIHALLGENGAGKSTLMKILYGFYKSDSGQILHLGNPCNICSPQDARAVQIGMVFQDLSLIPAFSVAENIALFLPELPAILRKDEITKHITDISTQYNLQVNPDAIVAHLSIGEQQKVEILKLLLSDARLLILDEPTRVLAPHEISAFFNILARLKKDGYAIVLITHKLSEVLACADRITVLRGGRVAGSLLRKDADEGSLIEMMFAKKLSTLKIQRQRDLDTSNTPILELYEIGTQGEGDQTSLENINLQIYPGEIVGVAGVSGNGQKELGDLVLGMIKCKSGTKLFNNEDITDLSITEVRKRGVVFIPENPLVMATVPYMTVLENFTLSNTRRYGRRAGMVMDWSAARSDIQKIQQELEFNLPLSATAKSLSGGNLQRLVILREMSHQPNLIIASYLTRGLDVQSTLTARRALLTARDQGTGVLLISEDMEELFSLSDRLIVLFQGRIVGEFTPEETDIYEIGYLMTGSEGKYVSKK